jgi:hypothetical protein
MVLLIVGEVIRKVTESVAIEVEAIASNILTLL